MVKLMDQGPEDRGAETGRPGWASRVKALVTVWAVVAFALGWGSSAVASYYRVKTDVDLTKRDVDAIERRITDHEKAQAEAFRSIAEAIQGTNRHLESIEAYLRGGKARAR